MDKINIISLFSGAGGFDLGFEQSGKFSTLLALEYNKTFANTLQSNKGQIFNNVKFLEDACILNEDILNTTGEELFKLAGITKDNNFGIIGGPPCQSFSIMGKQLGLSDDRGNFVFEFIRIVNEMKPSFFVFENVPNLKTIDSGKIYNAIMDDFLQLGYKVTSSIVDASNYGAWTFRKRLIIIGCKDIEIRMPNKTHDKISNFEYNLFEEKILPLKKCSEILNTIMEPSSTNIIPNHTIVKHNTEVLERFSKLKPGEKDLIRRRYKLNGERPAHTVIAGGEGAYRMNIHPNKNRELTLRENALIQGFPINYKFAGASWEVAKQIANAVPIQLAETLGRQIYKQLTSSNSHE
jgi:DNA (cytosine-5)-methyltransferase 1